MTVEFLRPCGANPGRFRQATGTKWGVMCHPCGVVDCGCWSLCYVAYLKHPGPACDKCGYLVENAWYQPELPDCSPTLSWGNAVMPDGCTVDFFTTTEAHETSGFELIFESSTVKLFAQITFSTSPCFDSGGHLAPGATGCKGPGTIPDGRPSHGDAGGPPCADIVVTADSFPNPE